MKLLSPSGSSNSRNAAACILLLLGNSFVVSGKAAAGYEKSIVDMDGRSSTAVVPLHSRGDRIVKGFEKKELYSITNLTGGAVKARGKAAPVVVAEVETTNLSSLLQTLKVLTYFALWYFLNVMYNIYNKKLMNVLPAPASIGTVQLLIGAIYSYFKWITGLSKMPILTKDGKSKISKVGIYHGAGQMLSIVSMGAGPVSFTHIVKALEPFFSAVVSALVFGKWMKPQVYATLIPVVGGVSYACLKEKSFCWLQFNTAMGSNVAFALRAVMSKMAMTTNVGQNVGPATLFGIVTIYAFLYSVPAAMIIEGTSIIDLWNNAISSGDKTQNQLITGLIVSGLLHYLNNEVMYLALSNVHPVTLAVGNTMKRVFIIVASVLVFRTPISLQVGIGSAIGISGVLLYSLTKQYYEKLEAAEAAAEAASKKRMRPNRVGARRKGVNTRR